MRRTALVLAMLSFVLAAAAPAQVRDTAQARRAQQAAGLPRPPTQIGTPHYDVVLEVPELSVDSIGLNVANLVAHLALDANAANLVQLNAGADVSIERVQLELTGVVAEAYVYVDLDNVARIVDRVLVTLSNNPEILTQLLTTVDTVVGTVGGVANQALRPGGAVSEAVGAVGRTLDNVSRPDGLLSRTVDSLGRTVQRTLDTSGGILEQTLDASGNVLSSRSVGRLLDLPVVEESTNAAGQTVRQVRDRSGALVELTLDSAGSLLSSRVLRPAPRR